MNMDKKAANARQPSETSRAIAAQIRAERAAANMTKDDVLKAAGISRTTYYLLESGDRTLDVTQLANICKAIGISMSDLLERATARMTPAEDGDKPRRAAQ